MTSRALPPPTVLYIVGQSHVGSTYLSRVLNQHPHIFDAGELNKLHHRMSPGAECACQFGPGGKIGECDFWRRLMRALEAEGIALNELSCLSDTCTGEWRRALFGRPSGRRQRRFVENNLRLFDAIRQYSGKPITLDCSKSPWRLLPLFRSRLIRVKVLHLMRNPRGQIASRMNRGKGFWHTSILKYWRKNSLCVRLFDHDEAYLRVSFDQFLEAPDAVLSGIFQWLGVAEMDPFAVQPASYHHLAGGWARRDPELKRPSPALSRRATRYTRLQNRCLRFLEHRFRDQSTQEPF
ncbi:sulfotransferase [Gammaproteobacteria bacterium AB-CW1]|uniref:Sulfotransferase n=1 Tax=Natronospira elongata TaxID=3110268 RepID=A0AAP6MK74_9GAMM|nr:sulfotransferase [Gammaproteobacteria bacterium AB-CW1]